MTKHIGWLVLLAACTEKTPLPGGDDPSLEVEVLAFEGDPPTATEIFGVVDDPQFDTGEYDLATQRPIAATLNCDADEPQIVIDVVGSWFGGNTVTLFLSGHADLKQWADFNAYGDDDYYRILHASGGEMRLTEDDPCAAGAVAGSFDIDTDAGRVWGTFVTE